MGAYRLGEFTRQPKFYGDLKSGNVMFGRAHVFLFHTVVRGDSTGAHLFGRTRGNALLAVEKVLEDGSYLLNLLLRARRAAA